MTNLNIKANKSTPSVVFNTQTGTLEIKGRSIPENAIAFYDPIHHVVKEYIANSVAKNTINIQLDYLNSSSTACILNILREFEKLDVSITTDVNWFYEEEDEDILNVGLNFSTLVKLKFKMVVFVDEDED